MRVITLEPYNSQWVIQFQEEANKLQTLLGDEVVHVHHIGSTSIPGMTSKPIIDLLVEVHNIENVDCFNEGMMKLGYEPCGENGIPKRRFFRKGGDDRTHHVHAFQTGNSEVQRHIDFRDYMITHPPEAKTYMNLKIQLVSAYDGDVEQYIDGKHDFIQQVDEKARAWRKNFF